MAKYKTFNKKVKASKKAVEFRNTYIELDDIANETYGNSFEELDEKEQKELSLKLAKERGYI